MLVQDDNESTFLPPRALSPFSSQSQNSAQFSSSSNSEQVAEVIVNATGSDIDGVDEEVGPDLVKCCICLKEDKELEDPIGINCCIHTFCRFCISKWCETSRNCPLGKKAITVLDPYGEAKELGSLQEQRNDVGHVLYIDDFTNNDFLHAYMEMNIV